MSNFKLLAIRPLKGCHDDFRKVLTEDEIYRFYNDYKYKIKGDRVERITYKATIPENLYDIKRPNYDDLKVNISAIVGKNGSGKSTLLELFFVAIYLLALKRKMLDWSIPVANERLGIINETRNARNEDNISTENFDALFNELIERLNGLDTKSEFNLTRLISLKKLLNQFSQENEILGENTILDDEEKYLRSNLKFSDELIGKVKVEIFYQINNNCYCLRIAKQQESEEFVTIDHITSNLSTESDQSRKKKDILITNVIEEDIDLTLNFFYSIAISYSHYSLNTKRTGDWLESVFHKNDGYQTPLVINPMRTEGIININVENELVKQRFLANILEPIVEKPEKSLRNFAPKKTAKKLKLRIDRFKLLEYERRYQATNIQNGDQCLSEFYLQYTGLRIESSVPPEPLYIDSSDYILFKLVKICENYSRYKEFYNNGRFENVEGFATQLISDSSHVTFKVKQALNLLRHKLYFKNYSEGFLEIDIQKFSDHIQSIKTEEFELHERRLSTIELIPPSIFNINVILDDKSDFEDLSSGEKQQIHSISSVVYHITNLNSVFENNDDKFNLGIGLKKYKYINILYDEVEQYFHPDLQRTFILNLLSYLAKINVENTKHISALNIVCATHSPFILSDIPQANTLRLEEGNPKSTVGCSENFGANIFDLLADSFFLRDGSVGAFARSRIQLILDSLKNESSRHPKIASSGQLSPKEIKSNIDLIGEPFIKAKLTEMFYKKFNKEERISRLKKELDKLEGKK